MNRLFHKKYSGELTKFTYKEIEEVIKDYSDSEFIQLLSLIYLRLGAKVEIVKIEESQENFIKINFQNNKYAFVLGFNFDFNNLVSLKNLVDNIKRFGLDRIIFLANEKFEDEIVNNVKIRFFNKVNNLSSVQIITIEDVIHLLWNSNSLYFKTDKFIQNIDEYLFDLKITGLNDGYVKSVFHDDYNSNLFVELETGELYMYINANHSDFTGITYSEIRKDDIEGHLEKHLFLRLR